jgi:hypothetical protein
MGNTGFNLREAIDGYIGAVKNQGSLTNADAEELSAHLYDATADLQTSGLSEEEAFVVASKRMGNAEVIGTEYGKVNPSVAVNKVWAYLILGFNLLYGLPSLLNFRYAIISIHTDPFLMTYIALGANLLSIAAMVFIVMHKHIIASFIKRQVESHTVRIVILSFLPYFIRVLLVTGLGTKLVEEHPFIYSNPSLIFFSSFLASISIAATVLCLIFSINLPGKFRMKILFEKPSMLFLILFSIFTGVLAASMRALPYPIPRDLGIVLFLFGLIYGIGSFLISKYNNGKLKYNITYLLPSAALEATGIRADMIYHRIDNVYFISVMLIAVFAGWYIGLKMGKRKEIAVG